MQKAFEKIKERLENLDIHFDNGDFAICNDELIVRNDAIEIVNQVAEEYEHKLSICNNSFYENMPQDFRDAVKVIMGYCQHEDCAYSCDDCSDCPNPLSVIRCGDTLQNDGWIPCSERLPEETEEDLSGDYLDHLDELIERGVFKPYLVTIEGAKVPTELYYVGSCGEVLWYDEITEEFYKVIAWQELPTVYQPKGE